MVARSDLVGGMGTDSPDALDACALCYCTTAWITFQRSISSARGCWPTPPAGDHDHAVGG